MRPHRQCHRIVLPGEQGIRSGGTHRRGELPTPPWAVMEWILPAPALGVTASETGAAGPDNRMRPVSDLEFGENAGDVVTDCLGADEQLPCDLAVRLAGGHEVENLAFPRGKLGEE